MRALLGPRSLTRAPRGMGTSRDRASWAVRLPGEPPPILGQVGLGRGLRILLVGQASDPARMRLVTDLISERSRAGWGRRLGRGLVNVVFTLLFEEPVVGLPGGPNEWSIEIKDRFTGDVLDRHAFGSDQVSAEEGRRMIEKDLDRLTFDEFVREYGIDWRHRK